VNISVTYAKDTGESKCIRRRTGAASASYVFVLVAGKRNLFTPIRLDSRVHSASPILRVLPAERHLHATRLYLVFRAQT
jgi:hypothetical protein